MSNEENQSESESSAVDEATEDQSNDFFDDESIEQLQQRLSAAEAKVAENWDLVVRTKAEIENVKRRAQRDVESARKYSVEKFASDLLPVVDSLEQGIETSINATDIDALREGLEMTTKMFISTLEKQGLIQVHPAGEKFNPEYHEAMSMIESDEIEMDHVITVFQKGYQLNGRLVRPARVVISRGQADVPSIDENA